MIELMLIILFKAGGVPLINYTIYLPLNTSVINITLPVAPIPDTIEAINDSTGSPIPVSLYPNNVLAIFAFGGGYVSIVYYGNYTFNSKSLLYSFNINSETDVTIIFPPYIIPFNLPLNIVSYQLVNRSILVITFPPGNYTIQYAYVPRSLLTSTITSATTSTSTVTTTVTNTSTVVSTPVTSTTSSTPSVTTSTTSTTTVSSSTTSLTATVSSSVTSTTSTTTESQLPIASIPSSVSPSPFTLRSSPLLYVAVAVALAVIVSAVAMLSRHRAVQAVEKRGLDDVDMLIISVLRQYGGSLYQSQLQQLTNLPKSTLWRHVMKLRDMGIVRVDKVDGLNKVTLISRI